MIPNTVVAPKQSELPPSRDLIAIGSTEPRKNQQFLLRVLRAAKDRGHSYSLTIAGDGETLAPLKELTTELGLADQVLFLGHVVNASTLIPAHRLLVHAALMESFGIIFLEALASGVPILAPAVGGIPEIFEDGVQGRFWRLDDVAGAAGILISIMENDGLRLRMSSAATQRYDERFEKNEVFSRLEGFLDNG
jgi:glycosyltransferase involved in cell wall biosynthesis